MNHFRDPRPAMSDAPAAISPAEFISQQYHAAVGPYGDEFLRCSSKALAVGVFSAVGTLLGPQGSWQTHATISQAFIEGAVGGALICGLGRGVALILLAANCKSRQTQCPWAEAAIRSVAMFSSLHVGHFSVTRATMATSATREANFHQLIPLFGGIALLGALGVYLIDSNLERPRTRARPAAPAPRHGDLSTAMSCAMNLGIVLTCVALNYRDRAARVALTKAATTALGLRSFAPALGAVAMLGALGGVLNACNLDGSYPRTLPASLASMHGVVCKLGAIGTHTVLWTLCLTLAVQAIAGLGNPECAAGPFNTKFVPTLGLLLFSFEPAVHLLAYSTKAEGPALFRPDISAHHLFFTGQLSSAYRVALLVVAAGVLCTCTC